MTPLMYPASFLFDNASTAYIALIALNIFSGIIFTLTTYLLDTVGQNNEVRVIGISKICQKRQ